MKILQIQIGRFQNIANKAIKNWRKVECLIISNVVNTKVANLLNTSPKRGQMTHYLWKTLKDVNNVVFSYENTLASLAC